MDDSQYSASELRKRYLKGGSLPDSDLSAGQIRSRYAIPSNSQTFSTGSSGKNNNVITIISIVVAISIFVFLYIMFFNK